MSEFTAEDKKLLIEAMGKGMGDAMKAEMPNIIAKSEEHRKEYIERFIRIETKLDILLGLDKK